MSNIYTDMCADLFHYGHVNILKNAKQLVGEDGNLIVGIHSDKTIESYKRKPIMTMEERIAVVEACRYVDRVILDAPLVITEDYIKNNNIDMVVHAHPENEDEKYQKMYEIPTKLGIFKRLEYTPSISTTNIISRLSAQK